MHVRFSDIYMHVCMGELPALSTKEFSLITTRQHYQRSMKGSMKISFFLFAAYLVNLYIIVLIFILVKEKRFLILLYYQLIFFYKIYAKF